MEGSNVVDWEVAERDKGMCVCKGGTNLSILKEVQKAYEQRLEVIDKVGGKKKLQMEVEVLRAWVGDLVSQNSLLARACEELEAEATRQLLAERARHNEGNKRKLPPTDVKDLMSAYDLLLKENLSKDREIRKLHKDTLQYEHAIVNLRKEVSIKNMNSVECAKKDAEVMVDTCGRNRSECAMEVNYGAMLKDDAVKYQDRMITKEGNLKLIDENVLAFRKVNLALSEEVHALRKVCAALDEQCCASKLRAKFKDEIIKEMRRQLKQAKTKLSHKCTSAPSLKSSSALIERSAQVSDEAVNELEQSLRECHISGSSQSDPQLSSSAIPDFPKCPFCLRTPCTSGSPRLCYKKPPKQTPCEFKTCSKLSKSHHTKCPPSPCDPKPNFSKSAKSPVTSPRDPKPCPSASLPPSSSSSSKSKGSSPPSPKLVSPRNTPCVPRSPKLDRTCCRSKNTSPSGSPRPDTSRKPIPFLAKLWKCPNILLENPLSPKTPSPPPSPIALCTPNRSIPSKSQCPGISPPCHPKPCPTIHEAQSSPVPPKSTPPSSIPCVPCPSPCDLNPSPLPYEPKPCLLPKPCKPKCNLLPREPYPSPLPCESNPSPLPCAPKPCPLPCEPKPSPSPRGSIPCPSPSYFPLPCYPKLNPSPSPKSRSPPRSPISASKPPISRDNTCNYSKGRPSSPKTYSLPHSARPASKDDTCDCSEVFIKRQPSSPKSRSPPRSPISASTSPVSNLPPSKDVTCDCSKVSSSRSTSPKTSSINLTDAKTSPITSYLPTPIGLNPCSPPCSPKCPQTQLGLDKSPQSPTSACSSDKPTQLLTLCSNLETLARKIRLENEDTKNTGVCRNDVEQLYFNTEIRKIDQAEDWQHCLDDQGVQCFGSATELPAAADAGCACAPVMASKVVTTKTQDSGSSPRCDSARAQLQATLQILKNKEDTVRVQADSLAVAEDRIKALSKKVTTLKRDLDLKVKEMSEKQARQAIKLGCGTKCRGKKDDELISEEVDQKRVVATLQDNLSVIQELYRESFYEAAKQDELMEKLRSSCLEVRLMEREKSDEVGRLQNVVNNQKWSLERCQDIAAEVENLKSEISNFLNGSNNDSGTWSRGSEWEPREELQQLRTLAELLAELLATDCDCALEMENKKLKTENASIKKQLSELCHKNCDLNEALKERENKLKTLENENQEKNVELQTTRNQLKQAREKEKEKSEACSCLELQLTQMKETLVTKTEELAASERQCNCLKTTVEMLQQELEIADQLNKENSEIRLEVSHLSEQVSMWREQLSGSEQRVRRVRAELLQSRDHCRQLDQCYREKVESLREVEEQLVTAQQRGAALCGEARGVVAAVRGWVADMRGRGRLQQEKIKEQETEICNLKCRLQSQLTGNQRRQVTKPTCSGICQPIPKVEANIQRTPDTSSVTSEPSCIRNCSKILAPRAGRIPRRVIGCSECAPKDISITTSKCPTSKTTPNRIGCSKCAKNIVDPSDVNDARSRIARPAPAGEACDSHMCSANRSCADADSPVTHPDDLSLDVPSQNDDSFHSQSNEPTLPISDRETPISKNIENQSNKKNTTRERKISQCCGRTAPSTKVAESSMKKSSVRRQCSSVDRQDRPSLFECQHSLVDRRQSSSIDRCQSSARDREAVDGERSSLGRQPSPAERPGAVDRRQSVASAEVELVRCRSAALQVPRRRDVSAGIRCDTRAAPQQRASSPSSQILRRMEQLQEGLDAGQRRWTKRPEPR